MTTLKEAIRAIESIKISTRKVVNIADQLLGKYKGIIPKGQSSTEFIQGLRGSLYGKVK